jgi:hypothetical protein
VSYYNSTIFKVAAKESFLHISWLIALIGIPSVFFRGEFSFQEKCFLFIGFLVAFWLFYLLLCFVFHRFSLRNKATLNLFLEKSDLEKGKDVGSYLEGW